MKTFYAPVVVTTMCRDKHFIKCIESLKENSWAKRTDIFVGIDYPIKEEQKEGYDKICEYVRNGDFSDFASFNVFMREENYGSVRNAREIKKIVREKYDRYIFTEDDNVFSPDFLKFIDEMLKKYEDDEDVVAVCGYSYPLKWKAKDGANAMLCNFHFSAWGTGHYFYKRDKIEKEIDSDYLKNDFKKIRREKAYKRLTDARFISYSTGVTNELGRGLVFSSSDVGLGVYLGIRNKFVVMPALSKVRNEGFDGSGKYCEDTKSARKKFKSCDALIYDYSSQPISDGKNEDYVVDENKNCKENMEMLNGFDSRKKSGIIRCRFKLFLYNILGKKRFFALKNKLSGKKKG